MSKPSVVFFNRVYPPGHGATGRMLRDLAHGFVADGWDVNVITTGHVRETFLDEGVRVIRLKVPMRKKNMFGYGLAWIKMLLAGLWLSRKDLVVSMTDPPMLIVVGRVVAKIKRCPHMHWCHDIYPDLLPVLGFRCPLGFVRFLRKISHRSLKQCDRIVVIGRCMARKFIHFGVSPNKISVIPNWADSELQTDEKRSESLHMKGIQKKSGKALVKKVKGARPFSKQVQSGGGPKFRVLYAGSLGRGHPVDTILGAAEILGDEFPEIEFTFVGSGPAFERLSRERQRRDLENIRILPFQPASHLRHVMESGDIHLISMKHDVLGLLVPCKLYSALAVERPCVFIGPEESETAQIIQEFGAGSVVPQGDPELLAQTIKQYRLSGDVWFSSYRGAMEAGKVLTPKDSIAAWLVRARDVAGTANKERARQRRKRAV